MTRALANLITIMETQLQPLLLSSSLSRVGRQAMREQNKGREGE